LPVKWLDGPDAASPVAAGIYRLPAAIRSTRAIAVGSAAVLRLRTNYLHERLLRRVRWATIEAA
jgi:hypothetical protein